MVEINLINLHYLRKMASSIDGSVLDIVPSPEINENTVMQGIAVAFKTLKAEKKEKKKMFDNLKEKRFKLTIEVYKIPPIPPEKNKIIHIRLRHSHIPPTSGVCLLAQDWKTMKGRPDNEKAALMYKDHLQLKGIAGITRIIPLDQLRKEYKTHESKRQLCNSEEFFISDETIMSFLPRLLGREFWTKKKVPVKVNMKSPKLKEEIEKALKTVNLIVHGRGSNFSVTVGYVGVGEQKLLDNIMGVCTSLKKSLPGGWANVKSLHLATGSSTDIPIFFNDGSCKVAKIAVCVQPKKITDEQEITTISEYAKVHPRGKIRLTKAKRKADVEEEEMEEVY